MDTFSHEPAYNEHKEQLVLYYAFLNENLDRAMSAVTELLAGRINFLRMGIEGDFDDNKLLLDVMRMKSVEKANSITTEGLQYALSYSSSGLKSYADRFEALRSDVFTCKLAQKLLGGQNTQSLEELKGACRAILAELTRRVPVQVSVHAQDQGGIFDKVNSGLESMWRAVGRTESPSKPAAILSSGFVQHRRQHIFKTPQAVNYCVEALPIPSIADPEYGKLLVLGQLLTHSYLHREVREKGGAYGGGCIVDPSGLFSFFSYRDPRLEDTFATYQSAALYATKGNFTDHDIVDAKIVAFQKIDKARDPAEDGLQFFTRGITEAQLDQVRKEALGVTHKGLVEMAFKHLKLATSSKTVCAMGEIKNEERLRKEGWNIIDVGMLVHDKGGNIDF